MNHRPLRLLSLFTALAGVPACSSAAVTTDTGPGIDDVAAAVDATTTDARPITPADDVTTTDVGPLPDAPPSMTCASYPEPHPVENPMLGHHSAVPETLHPTTAARLIVLGDSISAGVGAANNAQAYASLLANNVDAAWPADTETDLTSLFHLPMPIPVVNVAVGGATTTTMVRDQIPALRRQIQMPTFGTGHSVVVITIGGNDLQGAIISGNPLGPLMGAIANIRQTITFLQDPQNLPGGVSIYLAVVYDPSDGEGQACNCFANLRLTTFIPALDTWRERYRQLGMETGVAIVDALGYFHGHARNYSHPGNAYYDRQDPTGWFASDCIHPNPRGHHEMRRLFFEAINPNYMLH